MIRRPHLLLALLIALGVVAGLSVRVDVAAANGCPLRLAQGTEGTEASPILVSDRASLEVLASDSTCYASQYVFRQTADIDLSASAWTPIGDGSFSGFDGVYDGAGHRIVGMTVSSSSRPLGLFSQLYAATVRDLVLSGARVTATGAGLSSGVLTAYASGATIARVRVLNSTIVGVDNVGGLIGGSCYSQIAMSRSEASVSGSANVGGLIGSTASACLLSAGGASIQSAPPAPMLSDSSATGSVSGTGQVGGLIGDAGPIAVSRSFATGAVTASEGPAGGLVGRMRAYFTTGDFAPEVPNFLVDVYATGAVTGAGEAGGLVGVLEAGVPVTRAYAVGRVAGGVTGGLVGGGYLACTGTDLARCGTSASATAPPTSFWNSETTGQGTSYGGVALARTTVQLQSLGTFADAGWTITRGWSDPTAATWGICPSANGGYPFLLAQYSATTQPCAGLPSAPRDLKAIVGDGRITVSWQAPASDGGSPVTGFTATAVMQKNSPKAAPTCTAAGGATSCTITGLRNGRTYRISATAANIEGTGTAATIAATPRIGLAVISTQRSGLTIVTRVRVGSAGRLTQVGTAKGIAGTACRAGAQPKRAGVIVLRCALTARAEQALAAGPLAVVATLRFRPTTGPVRTALRTVRFAQTDAAGPVTG